MKCLSLWQPYASFLVWGVKGPETRGWSTQYRGPVVIHAAKHKERGYTDQDEDFAAALYVAGKSWKDLPYGALLGVGNLVRVWRTEDVRWASPEAQERERYLPDKVIPALEYALGDYSAGRFAWEFDKFRVFDEPIPYKGMQGLFDVPDEIVRDALQGARAR